MDESTTDAKNPEIREQGFFDRFAAAVSTQVSHAWFFSLCVLLILFWLPSKPLFGSMDTWQLVINTLTTCVTFLLVALIQNAQARFENTTNLKLNAVAAALADLMDAEAATLEPDDCEALFQDASQLRKTVGSEKVVGA